MSQENPKVFISYSHDSPEHSDKVLEFSNRLRKLGIDTILDQYNPNPPEGWPRWMKKRIKEAKFVLLICTERYRKRFDGEEEDGVGLGVAWEAHLTTNDRYRKKALNEKILPVLFSDGSNEHIPDELVTHTHYFLDDQLYSEDLYRWLTNQSKTKKPELGPIKKLRPIDRSEGYNPKLPPHNLPFSGVKKFVGRTKAMKQIDRLMEKQQRPVSIISIKGMGGIGKTELAIQYASRRILHYPGGVCWSKVRENDAAAQILNYAITAFETEAPDSIKTSEDRVQWLWNHWPHDSNTLIIFDDVINYASIEKLLPPSPSQFTVLMTTRNQLGGAVESLDLEVLSIKEAQSLLISCIGKKLPKASKGEATELCKRLGRLPLAIELVGRYLFSKSHLSFEEMTQRLNVQGLSHRSMKEADQGMTGNLGVESALGLTWDELGDQSKDLALVLGLFALAPISWKLIPACLPDEDPEELEDMLHKELIGRSLVKRTTEGFVELHQLVWEFFRRKLDEDPNKKEKAKRFAKVMAEVASEIPQALTLDYVAKFRPVVPHLEEVCELQADALEDDDFVWPFVGLGRFYVGLGLFSEAEPWFQKSYDYSQERFGEEHQNVAASLNNLAGLYESQGRYEEAEPLYVKALDMKRKLLGEEHSSVATSLHNLAKVYRSQGRYEEAEPMYVQALKMWRKLLGEEHPYVATNLNNLALLYKTQGRYEEAEPLYAQALEMSRKLLGEEHPVVASNLNNLAGLYRTQGSCEMAEPLYEKALEILEKKLGADHPNTVIVRENYELIQKEREGK